MTEENTKEIQQAKTETNENQEKSMNWGTLVTKSHVRLKVWQILKLFGELNVTQISNLLKESKSTVSRHLNGMEDDGLVKSREDDSCCEGRIAPKVFSINDVDKEKIKSGFDQNQGMPEDFNEQVEFIKSEIQTNRSSIEMIAGIMKLLLPIYDEVEKLMKEGTDESMHKAVKIFNKYMWGEKGENITWFKFNYVTSSFMEIENKMYKFAYNLLSDEFDPATFEEKRLKLKAEMKEAKAEQMDNSHPKKYGRFGIDVPLRKIFKKNAEKKTH